MSERKGGLAAKWNQGKKKAGDAGEAVPVEDGRYVMQLLKAEATTIQDARKVILKWGVVSAPEEDDKGKVCTDFYTIDDEERIVWLQRTLVALGVDLDEHDIETEDDLIALIDGLIEEKTCAMVQVSTKDGYRNMRARKKAEVDEDDLLDVDEALGSSKAEPKGKGKGKDEDEDEDDGDDYASMDVDELLGLCGERDIKVPKDAKSSKKKLVKLLEEWDADNAGDDDDGDEDEPAWEKGDKVRFKKGKKTLEGVVAKVDGDDITVKVGKDKHEVAAGDLERAEDEEDGGDSEDEEDEPKGKGKSKGKGKKDDEDDEDDEDEDEGEEPEFEVGDKVLVGKQKGKISKVDSKKEQVEVKFAKDGKREWVPFAKVAYQVD